MKPSEYPITGLADFLTVPPDRLADCLTDFAAWLRVASKADAINEQASIALGGSAAFSLDSFTWVDDGVRGNSAIDIMVADGENIARWALPSSQQGGA